MKWLALAVCLMPLAAGAEEHPFLASLIDTLSRPDLSAPDLLAGLEAMGFSVVADVSDGSDYATLLDDPSFYFFTAILRSSDRTVPLTLVNCSRISAAHVARLPTEDEAIFGDLDTWVPTLQYSDTVKFPTGALAQLWCEVKLVPVGDPLMPTVHQIKGTLQSQFDEVSLKLGSELMEEQDIGAGSVLYPPLTAPSGDGGPLAGDTQLFGQNDNPMADRRASWIWYFHFEGIGTQSFTVVSHLAPQGF